MLVFCCIDIVFTVFNSLTMVFVFFTGLAGSKRELDIGYDSLVEGLNTVDILGCGVPRDRIIAVCYTFQLIVVNLTLCLRVPLCLRLITG